MRPSWFVFGNFNHMSSADQYLVSGKFNFQIYCTDVANSKLALHTTTNET